MNGNGARPDAFTTAARAESERKHPVPASYDPRVSQYERLLAQGAFRAGAAWARDHLAAHSDLTVDSETVTVESDEPTAAKEARA